jgi:hypothetical protein
MLFTARIPKKASSSNEMSADFCNLWKILLHEVYLRYLLFCELHRFIGLLFDDFLFSLLTWFFFIVVLLAIINILIIVLVIVVIILILIFFFVLDGLFRSNRSRWLGHFLD